MHVAKLVIQNEFLVEYKIYPCKPLYVICNNMKKNQVPK